MYCIECGDKIAEGEQICKGCGHLTASVREELLAMTEKTADIKCQKCGGKIKPGHRYCSACGEPVAC